MPANQAQKLLMELGVKLAELSDVTGKTAQACGKWMRGESVPGNDLAAKIQERWPEVRRELWLQKPREVANTAKVSTTTPKRPPQKQTSTEPPKAPDTAREAALDYLVMVREMRREAQKQQATNLIRITELERRAILDFAKFNGELTATEESRLTETKRWKEIRSALIQALVQYPDAARAVVEKLEELEG